MDLTPFEYCLRKKVTFATNKGPIGLQDLFDLPLTSDTNKPNLNDLAKSINRIIGTDEQEFVDTAASKVDQTHRIMLEAVKRVIAIRQAENRATAEARTKSAQKEELLAALAEAERGQLKAKTPDELRAMIAAL